MPKSRQENLLIKDAIGKLLKKQFRISLVKRIVYERSLEVFFLLKKVKGNVWLSLHGAVHAPHHVPGNRFFLLTSRRWMALWYQIALGAKREFSNQW